MAKLVRVCSWIASIDRRRRPDPVIPLPVSMRAPPRPIVTLQATAFAVAFALAIAVASQTSASAQSGPGRVVFPVPAGGGVTFGESPFSGGITALAVRSDGRILAAGLTQAADRAAIAELQPGGAVDPGFGSAGIVTPPTPAAMGLLPSAVLPEADGGALIAGSSTNNFVLLRLDAAGSLDPSFANGGVRSAPPMFRDPTVSLLPNGRIMIAGFAASGPHQPFVERLTAAGAADLSFGSSGVALLPGGGGTSTDLATFPDGSSVVLYSQGSASHTALAGLTPSGMPNPAFNNGTPVVLPVDGTRVLGQADMSVLVLESSGAVARYTAAGTPDVGYGTGGTAPPPPGAGTSLSFSLLAGPGGTAIEVSKAKAACGRIAIERLSSSGQPDALSSGTLAQPFGGGAFVVPVGPLPNLACGTFGQREFAAASRSDGGVLLGTGIGIDEANGEGAVNTDFIQQWAIAALQPTGASLDPTFGAPAPLQVRARVPRQRPFGAVAVRLTPSVTPVLALVSLTVGGKLMTQQAVALFKPGGQTTPIALNRRARRMLLSGARLTVGVRASDLAGNVSSFSARARLR